MAVRPDTLADTGAILAVIDRDDRWHRLCSDTLHQLRFPLLTSEAVLTELFHLFGKRSRETESAWTFIRSGALTLATIADDELPRLHELMSPLLRPSHGFCRRNPRLPGRTRIPLHHLHRRPRRFLHLPHRRPTQVPRPPPRPPKTITCPIICFSHPERSADLAFSFPASQIRGPIVTDSERVPRSIGSRLCRRGMARSRLPAEPCTLSPDRHVPLPPLRRAQRRPRRHHQKTRKTRLHRRLPPHPPHPRRRTRRPLALRHPLPRNRPPRPEHRRQPPQQSRRRALRRKPTPTSPPPTAATATSDPPPPTSSTAAPPLPPPSPSPKSNPPSPPSPKPAAPRPNSASSSISSAAPLPTKRSTSSSSPPATCAPASNNPSSKKPSPKPGPLRRQTGLSRPRLQESARNSVRLAGSRPSCIDAPRLPPRSRRPRRRRSTRPGPHEALPPHRLHARQPRPVHRRCHRPLHRRNRRGKCSAGNSEEFAED